MSTSKTSQLGRQTQERRILLAVTGTALVFLAGCGGTSPGSSTSGSGSTAPIVNGIQPPTGSPVGGTLVTITGENFLDGVVGATQVTFAGLDATDVIVVDDSTITAITPSHVNDAMVDVEVINSLGIGTLGAGFHYLATATIVSDLNSDGLPDLAIGATGDATAGVETGAVYVFYGREGEAALADRMAGDADLLIHGLADGDEFGAVVQTGDVNGDGHTDLVVGSPDSDVPVADAGAVSIFLGPLPDSGVLDASSADMTLLGEGTVPYAWYGVEGDRFGTTISLGDSNADGILDVLIGAPGTDLNVGLAEELEDAGRVYLFLGGPQLAGGSADTADAILSGVREDDHFGSEVCLADMNADGQADLAVAFDVSNSGFTHQARVGIFSQGVAAGATSDDADMVLASSENGDQFGCSIACGDVNGDGDADLIVGAQYSNAFSSGSGQVYVFLGGPGFAGTTTNDADVIYTGQLTHTRFGKKIATADVNGDGYDDVLVSAPFSSIGEFMDGQAFIFFGEEVPVDNVAFSGDVVMTGEAVAEARFGSAIEVLDSDLDGIADVMSSAKGYTSQTGRVYVFQGEETLLDQSADDDDMTLTGENSGGGFGSSISHGK